MAKDSAFSTKREPALTGDQMLESLIRTRNARRQNTMAMAEAYKHKDTTPDFSATMESATKETERQLQQASALENMAYHQGVKNIGLARLGLRQRMITEGKEYLRGKVLGEIIYEAYWLDNPVKENAVAQIENTIEEMLSYVEESFSGSRVPDGKQSALLKNLYTVIEETVRKAADRICEECESDDTVFPDFTLTDVEESEMDEKLIDLGKDELVDLIKSKVAQVVQDEKEKGQERAEMFREIDQMSAEAEADTSDEPTEIEESVLMGVTSGEIITEGANWDTLKIYFSGLRKRASKLCKVANKSYKNGDYDIAKKKYLECKDVFEDIYDRLKDVDDTMGSTVISYFLTYVSLFIALTDSINTGGGSSNLDVVKAHEDFGTVNQVKQYAGANVRKMIQYCTSMASKCDKEMKTGKPGNVVKGSKYKYALDSVVYTTNEKHIASLMESGVDVRIFDDPSWGEFKAYVSMMCRSIQGVLNRGINRAHPIQDTEEKYNHAKCLIKELESKLANVPETVPGDVKEYIMAMVAMIYTAVPTDSVIISRFGSPTGSPDLKSSSPIVNFASISWTDLFVNIKTNLSSVKSYCEEQASGETITQDDVNKSDCPVSGRNSLAQLVATAQSRILTNNIGGSLFEAMMLGCISTSTRSAMESSLNISDEEIENAAMIESLLNYTILETLDSIGMYKFRKADVDSMRQHFMKSISESGAEAMSHGKDSNGLKKVRINTKKLKKKNNPMTNGKFDQS